MADPYPIVSAPAIRSDPPVPTDWGMVVRVVGGVVVVGPIAVTQGTVPWIVAGTIIADQGTPNIDANSWPVHLVGSATVLQGTVPWIVDIASMPTATLANGVETAVGAAAVSILPANGARKTAIVQNTGLANIRVGVVGVTAVTGLRVVPNGVVIYDMPFVAIQELFAIQEGAIGSTAFTQEVV